MQLGWNTLLGAASRLNLLQTQMGAAQWTRNLFNVRLLQKLRPCSEKYSGSELTQAENKMIHRPSCSICYCSDYDNTNCCTGACFMRIQHTQAFVSNWRKHYCVFKVLNQQYQTLRLTWDLHPALRPSLHHESSLDKVQKTRTRSPPQEGKA